ncbi:hypothetical protein H5410_015179 [Solanum commersonii]|uniref:Uncharacterized protein n=1 Tax=Solanum commersonii TaxID=4109 RepID=A0A9J5ZTD1_SOLCO|nr:hypothetical protein H5410_015179 [Solanum commersonii]
MTYLLNTCSELEPYPTVFPSTITCIRLVSHLLQQMAYLLRKASDFVPNLIEAIQQLSDLL